MEIKAQKVENGWILQVTKIDFMNRTPEVTITVHTSLEEVVKKIESLA